MPEIDFYFSKKDFAELGELIFSEGMLAVPCLDYPTSKYSTVDTLGGFVEAVNNCRQFFLLHESYNSCPLEVMHIIANDGREFYHFMPRNGGPTIDLLWYSTDEKGIRSGNLSHYPTYWDTKEKINLPAPESLKQEYRRLANFIKKGREKLTRPTIYNKSKRSVYLGTDAKRLRTSGVPLMGWDDLPPLPS